MKNSITPGASNFPYQALLPNSAKFLKTLQRKKDHKHKKCQRH